jgi:tetratricopeptide (TPR) repeat protein
LARSLTGLGVVARCADETPYARELIQEGLAIQRQLNDLKGIANSLSALSSVAYYAGDQTEAKGLCLEVKAILEELGNEEELTVIISNVGHVCLELGEYDAALQYLQETLRRSIAQRQTRFTLNILHGLAELSRKLGRDIQAYELALYISRDPLAYGDLVTDVQQLLHELGTKLPRETVAAAQARTVAWTMDDAAAEALALSE